jgi:hypothetical protein
MHPVLDGTGPFTLAQALSLGFSRAEIRAHLRAGRWVRLRRGVFVTRTDRLVASARPDTLHAQDVRAVQLALSRRQVVGAATSAAQILGLDLRRPPGPDVVLLTDDGGVASTHRDGYFLRVAPLLPDHVTSRHDTPITAPGRTLLDVSANHGFEDGVVATESAYRKRLITPAEFGSLLDANEGRPGIQVAREVHRFANPLTESVLETLSLLGFREMGVPMPLVQVVIVEERPRIRVDCFWPWIRLVGEADGMRKYEMNGRRPMAELREEREREQRIRDADCDIVRWDWRIASNPELLAARVFAAMERAEARLRGRAS